MRTRVSFLSVSRSSSRASDGGGDLLFEVGGGGDAGAVGAVAAEAGQGLAVGPEIAGLALALDGHGEHEGEGVFAGAGGAGEDERVGQAAGGDGGTERFDGGGVAEEFVEVGGECRRGWSRMFPCDDDTARAAEVGWIGGTGIGDRGGLPGMYCQSWLLPQFMEAFMIIGRSLECLGLHSL